MSETLVGKSFPCVEEVGAQKTSGKPRASGPQGPETPGFCSTYVLRCIVGRAVINAREVLILLIIVCMRGLLQADSGVNEEHP